MRPGWAFLERLDLRRRGRAQLRFRGWGRRPRMARSCARIGASLRRRAFVAWSARPPPPSGPVSSWAARPRLRARGREDHRNRSSGSATASRAGARPALRKDQPVPAPSEEDSIAAPSSRAPRAFGAERGPRCSTRRLEAGSSDGAPRAARWAARAAPPTPCLPERRPRAPRAAERPIDAARARGRARMQSTTRSPSGSTDRTVRRRCRSPCEPRPSWFLSIASTTIARIVAFSRQGRQADDIPGAQRMYSKRCFD